MKPCPFCGSEKIHHCWDNDSSFRRVELCCYCQDCSAQGPETTFYNYCDKEDRKVEISEAKKRATELWENRQ